MRLVFAFFFAFFSTFLSAEEYASFVNSENDTLALVAGVVNAYNGKLVQIDRDIEIQGSDPFELLRYYDGAHDFPFGEYGYGVGLSLPILLEFHPYREKCNVAIEQRTGSFLYFSVLPNKQKHYVGKIDSKLFTPIRNHRGDICILLNPETTATYRYSAFGSFCHSGTIRSPWLFSGQRYDQNISCYQFLKRQYDPETGRWLTADPLGFADGPNLYAYVHNNPLTFVDPYGLFGERIYDNTKGFLRSAGRGVADESSWGLTSYAFEEYQTATFASKAGYYTGYAASFAVGCFYGAPVIKGLFKGGKVAINGFRLLRSANTAAKASKGALATKSITKLTQDSKPILQKVAQSARKNNLLMEKQGIAFVGDYKYTKTVSNHLGDVVKKGAYKGELSRPYMNSPNTVNEIMKAGKSLPDPGGIPGAYLWKAPGSFRGANGVWELVVHPDKKIIYHYNFVK